MLAKYANGHNRVNPLKNPNTAIGICAIGDNSEAFRTSGITQQRTNRGDLLGQCALTRIRKRINRERSGGLNAAANNCRQSYSLEPSNRISFGPREMVPVV